MALDKILTELRSEQGLSQKQLAEAIGVSQSTIAKIEVGRNESTASTVRKLARYFQVSADYLLGLEDEFGAKTQEPTTNCTAAEERELLKFYRRLEPQVKAIALQTVKLWAEGGADGKPPRN